MVYLEVDVIACDAKDDIDRAEEYGTEPEVLLRAYLRALRARAVELHRAFTMEATSP